MSEELLLVGVSHRTAAVEVRERCAIEPGALREALASARSIPGVREVLMLSTCNRTEILVAGAPSESLEEALVQRFFARSEPGERYVFRGIQALAHLFRVASGLDSQVLGESQILAQLKESLGHAETEGAAGTELRGVVAQALGVGKRVRNETSIGEGTLSVARVGVDVVGHVFSDFDRVRTLIVGAGETGLLVARHLRERGNGSIRFANRSLERAERAAAEFGGEACSLAEAESAAKPSDLVVTCVDGGKHLFTPTGLKRAGALSRDRPLLMIDLSVPRAIDPSVAQLEQVLYYDLDDLSKVVDRNRQRRVEGDEQSSGILVAEIQKYLSRKELARMAPAVSALRERFESIRDELLAEHTESGSPGEEPLARELTKRLLDAAFTSFKEGARGRRSQEELDREYQRFLENL